MTPLTIAANGYTNKTTSDAITQSKAYSVKRDIIFRDCRLVFLRRLLNRYNHNVGTLLQRFSNSGTRTVALMVREKILNSFYQLNFRNDSCIISGPGSSVGIATGYGLDVSGDRISVGARFSAPVQNGPGAHPASCTIGTGSCPGVESGRGVTLTPHPF
jgi:hypothetical protein